MKKVNIGNEDSKIILDAISLLKNDLRFKSFDIDSSNLGMFYLMQEELDNCNGCNGLNNCKNKAKGYRYLCSDTKPYRFYYSPCKYKEMLNNKAKASSLVVTNNESKDFFEASLEDFRLNTDSRKKAFKYITNFISNFSSNSEDKGLYLCGKFGVGKTYLLKCLANEVSKKGFSTILMYFPDLARQLKSSFKTGDLEDIIYKLKTVDVLILDDLGGELLTSWLRDEVLGPILNHRFENKLPIFISSNMNINELFNHLSKTKDEMYVGNDDFKAGRIIQRIKSSLVFCELKDND